MGLSVVFYWFAVKESFQIGSRMGELDCGNLLG
jgi:hypothetical protein